MIVNPSKNQTLHCLAFNNTTSTASLNYVEAGAIKSIQTDFLYQSEHPLNITFDKIPSLVFNFMTDLSIVSYTVVLGKELAVPGTFSLIQHTLVNTSNCWNDVTLVYNRSDNSYITINAQPNDCLVTTPKVDFQYQLNNNWISIPIAPNSSSPESYFKFPFIHMDTKNYQIFSETQSFEIQQLITNFFTNFAQNRQLPIRIALIFTQAGSSLSQEIFGTVTKIETDTNNCILDLNSIAIVTAEAIQNVAALTSLNSCLISSTVTVTSVFQKQQISNTEPTTGISGKTAIVFNFQVKNDQILLQNLTGQQQQFFISFFDADGNIILEQTTVFDPIQSCFFDIISKVSLKNTCVVLFPTLTPICIEKYHSGVVTTQQQILQLTESTTSRIQYQVYQKKLTVPNITFYQECFNVDVTITESQFPFYPGDYAVRQKAFITDMKTAFRPSIFITNDIDYQLSYDVIIDQTSIILIYFWIIISVLLIIAVAVTAFYSLKQQ
eukprot:EST43149.1 Hypothetical protein SS50377_17206 [Spironucleus salmonicida]